MARFSARAIEKHIRKKHPGCPDHAIAFFVKEMVDRDWSDATLGKAVGITMQTTLRHTTTDYDQLLLVGVERKEALRRVQPKIDAYLGSWKTQPRQPLDEEPLKATENT
ncbi:DUF2293 domain-containing protein [Rhizobium sp. BG4]|uniref:DUF2293 domain-containing protein n=1 Tax=Rhizobium sp. BG4 TaxID=2613770 RepID=UPI00193CB543|nr:DUF2293 domain-containing protein [Rhizobium sp. BG4]QRM45844.1 DUF2293 domain-containing protein [Rhizobium sp. BG4]